ncbi:hypothetical protein AMS68_002961 [Peltaster fructicola]|uniref:Uncharacterized protein n=1 Tax=Peltaster fructicola TaxID=286661 RepID=A0A6H0XRT2_9PEZI|nr:hypothetical protein AMS68_002961 [Peltaster fructicola]
MIVHPSGTPSRVAALVFGASEAPAVSPRSHPAMDQERLQSPHLRDGQHDDDIRDPGQRMRVYHRARRSQPSSQTASQYFEWQRVRIGLPS